jgi:hypothetical protein
MNTDSLFRPFSLKSLNIKKQNCNGSDDAVILSKWNPDC